ncbi:polysaccharide pyruvyl transferase family protein [Cellvibrio sp. NN19]|uniref:polysaccharide pyruvyl transferase family protein n=1 Tax=Cellvibrio chitinivorans TaxID=3102792 RepID=UPI002B416B06|nr:polysaccharide pyruvyl transferase family protein [Cellvibrio sp. NN19]
MDSISILNVLSALPKHEPIYYRSNPGNAGDSLIACGAFLLFEKLGLDVRLADTADFDATGKIVLYAGGGNLVGYYSEARDFISKHHRTAKQFILLPHTVTSNEDLLAELGSNVILFARENHTFQHLLEHAPKTQVFLSDDLAFYISPKSIISSHKLSLFKCVLMKIKFKITKNNDEFYKLPRPIAMLRNSLFEFKSSLNRKKSGNFFRTDVERASNFIPEDNADLSHIYEYGTRNRDLCFYSAARLMKHIDLFEEINTDRLHICIAAALLGKRVNFFPNSYFKCRAVYEKSLKDKYINVIWNSKSS